MHKRNPNTKCSICGKPLYRRPFEFKKWKEFCCVGCRSALYKKREIPKELILGWKMTWMVGDNHLKDTKKTKNTRKKMSQSAKLFYKENPEFAKERGMKKSKNSNHKTELTLLIRTSRKYEEWRIAIFQRDNHKCKYCGKRPDHAHHIKPVSLILAENGITECSFEMLRKAMELNELWDIGNGIAVCVGCHKKLHKYNNIYVRRNTNRYREIQDSRKMAQMFQAC